MSDYSPEEVRGSSQLSWSDWDELPDRLDVEFPPEVRLKIPTYSDNIIVYEPKKQMSDICIFFLASRSSIYPVLKPQSRVTKGSISKSLDTTMASLKERNFIHIVLWVTMPTNLLHQLLRLRSSLKPTKRQQTPVRWTATPLALLLISTLDLITTTPKISRLNVVLILV